MRSPWLVVALVLALIGYIASENWTLPQAPTPAEAAPPVEMQPDRQANFLEAAVPFIAKWEGLRLRAYKDIAGVWTVCYGETNGVRPGNTHTKAECKAMLAKQVLAYRDRLRPFFTAETVAQRLPIPRDAAFTSFAYNVGVSGAGKSTATRRLNAGRIVGACEALTWWNKSGGRIVRGLVNRRSEEQALCLQGT